MKRYVIYADGQKIGHAETKEKAWKMARRYEDECLNQDEPFSPQMEIKEEIIGKEN